MSPEPIGKAQRPPPIEPVNESNKKQIPPKLFPPHDQARDKIAAGRVKKWNIEKILKTPKEIRCNILNGLSLKDLQGLDTALSKGNQMDPKLKEANQQFHTQIEESIRKYTLQEILEDNPSWASVVANWGHKVSIEDQIWLLRLYELRNLGVPIPQLDEMPSEKTLNLLKPATRQAIDGILSSVGELKLSHKKLKKCPQAICLLPNLFSLDLSHNELTVAPDVSRNAKLLALFFGFNQIKIVPNLSRNVNLRILYLNDNKLRTPPNVSRNVNLTQINLDNNKLKVAPNVSQNVKLEYLSLINNRLTLAPDVIRNLALRTLSLTCNCLRIPPDVRNNFNLVLLALNVNQLTVAPDVTCNSKLEYLSLDRNQLTKGPDLKYNVNLERLSLNENQLEVAPDVRNNVKLKELLLAHNKLKKNPDLRQNEELEILWLNNNFLKDAPDLSKNLKLKFLAIKGNRLTDEARDQIEELQKQRSL